MLGFIVGGILSQFAGAWAFRIAKKRFALAETRARWLAGVSTMLIAAPVFVVMRVHEWAAGEGSSWGVAVFLALCMGITQGVLFRGRPLERGA